MKERDWNKKLRAAELRCAEAGKPLTIQRRAVLRTLFEATDHPTADTVFERVAAQVCGLSRATVYRSLETLAELGLARKVSHDGVGVRFDGRVDKHHHVICRGCGVICDFEDADLDDLEPRTPSEFEVDDVSVTCIGTCESCRSPRD